MARRTESARLHKVLPRIEAPVELGLTYQQARERYENGYANFKPVSAERTVGQILRDNVFTYLNLVLMSLALCVILVGYFIEAMFMGVVIINTIIGVMQELRSRRALAKLQFITAPNATVIRGGERHTVSTEKTVLDDIAIFTVGQQIYADAIVMRGECHVNEALVTGEADEITKTPGDKLLSGSFVVSGECIARLDKVGRDSFVAQLTLEAKKTRGKQRTIGMISALKRLVQVIGMTLVPLGIAMVFRTLGQPDNIIIETLEQTISPVAEAIKFTVGAMVGIVPDGLYLLVSTTLTVSVLRLAQKKTLVQERNCVETLARVDVLCVDKTGTITEPQMDVKGVEIIDPGKFSEDDMDALLSDYVGNMPADNETMIAIQSHYDSPPRRRAIVITPFSSATKYSGVTYRDNESYLLGAPERILQSGYKRYRKIIEKHSAQGYRVLLFAQYPGDIDEKLHANSVKPLSLILLSNRVRAEAPKTFRFFEKQGVKIIVISGDNPITVSQIAREAGIANADRFVDAATLTTDRQIKRAVSEYVIFGRVTPDQKRKLVRALKAAGHTVAMTGDGVNDVLALKDANCSIAMASGSEVASQVSDIVLLNSDFSAMPAVVMEGRRVINNIERSSALFLTKNIFSFLLAILITIILGERFPLSAARFTLFNVMLIGVPSFVLAMEPNRDIVKGRFIVNVIKGALPAGLTDFAVLTALILICSQMGISDNVISTMALFVIAFVGFMFLYKICHPLNTIRIALIITMLVGFIIGALLFGSALGLEALVGNEIWLTIAFCATSVPLFLLLTLLMHLIGRKKR